MISCKKRSDRDCMRFVGVFLFLLCFLPSLLAQLGTPKYSNEFLAIGVGARALAMSSATTAHVSDVTAAYWQPARLLHVGSPVQASLMHSAYFGGLANYDYAGACYLPDTATAIAISVIRFSVDDIPDTRFLVDPSGSIVYSNIRFFSASDYGVLLSYAKRIKKLGGVDLGGSAKIIRRLVGSFAHSWGFGLDIGASRQVGQWGLSLMGRDLFGTFNAWSVDEEELALIYGQTGNEFRSESVEVTLPRFILGASRPFQWSQFHLLLATDVVMTTDGKRNALLRMNTLTLDPSVGVEVGFRHLAFVRLGAGQWQQVEDFDGSKDWRFQPNAGLGMKIGGVSVDYAFTDIGDVAAGLYSHVFSLNIDIYVDKD